MNLSVTDLLNLRLTCLGFYNYLSVSNKTIWQCKFHELLQESPLRISLVNDLLGTTGGINFMECCIRLGRIYRELVSKTDQPEPFLEQVLHLKSIALHIDTMTTYWAKPHLQSHHSHLAMGTFSPPNSPSKHLYFCPSCVIKTKLDSSSEEDLTVHPMVPSVNPTFPDPNDEEAFDTYMKVYEEPVHQILDCIREYLKKYPRLLSQANEVRFSSTHEPKIHINPITWTDTDLKLRLIKSNFRLISPLEFFNSPDPDPAVLSEYLDHLFQPHHHYKMRRCYPHSTFYFYEPFRCAPQHRKILTRLLFEKFRPKRVCLLSPLQQLIQSPEPAVLIHASSCNTVVSLYREGRIVGLQHFPSGTATIASYLYNLLRKKEDTKFVSPLCLMNDSVLQSCCLRYSQKYPMGGYAEAYVRDIWPGSSYRKILLGPERYRVPEQVYQEINFPAMIDCLVDELPEDEVQTALSHVIVTGAFSGLSGFQIRLETDLAKCFPDHSRNICVHLESQLDTSYGNSLPEPYFMPKVQGTEFWITREEYVLFGPTLFDLFPS